MANYVFKQHLHFACLLNEIHNIAIRAPLKGGHLFAFQKYYDFMQHLNALLIPFQSLISAFGEQGAFSLKLANCKLLVSISSIFSQLPRILVLPGDFQVAFFPVQKHYFFLCSSPNKNTEQLGEYFPVNSFELVREWPCLLQGRRYKS